MAAPPPPPPPPPPPSGPSNVPKPDNKNLLASICKGTSLKKVPDSVKNDRSDALGSAKPKVSNTGQNSMGPLVPPSKGALTIADQILARKNAKNSQSAHTSNTKRTEVPSPNVVPLVCVPPPPSQNKKPPNMSDVRSLPPPRNNSPSIRQPSQSETTKPPPPLPNLPQPPDQFRKASQEVKAGPMIYPPPPPLQVVNNPPPPPFPGGNANIRPPPPPKDIKPRFRPPMPLCNKPTVSDDKPQLREIESRGLMNPPPPPPMSGGFNNVRPPRFDPPPPPPSKIPPPIPSGKTDRPSLPVRIDSNFDFDSRFTFVDVKCFPEPNSVIKMRQN